MKEKVFGWYKIVDNEKKQNNFPSRDIIKRNPF